MKWIIFLLLIALPVFAQQGETEISIIPYVSTTPVDTLVVTAGSDTVYLDASAVVIDRFSSDSGLVIFGNGIPYGTTITWVSTTGDSIRLSANATKDNANARLEIGTYFDTTYVTGTWAGQTFLIWNSRSGGMTTIRSIAIVDSSDTLQNVDLALFSAFSDSLGNDRDALGVLQADAFQAVGYISLTGVVDMGSARIMEKDGINLVIPSGGTLYGRIVAKSTMHFTGVRPLKVKIRASR